jgi:two-component system response regulator NreC
MMSTRVRLVIADDHSTVREGLRLLLEREEDFEVAGEASNGRDVVRLVRETGADIAVLDLSMAETSGLTAARILREQHPRVRLVVLTRHADQTYLHELLRIGVAAYVLKQSPSTELIHAIRSVARGGQHVDSALTRHLAAPFVNVDGGRLSGATPRETQVLRLSAQGYSNKEIAQQLDVSVKTVEVHKASAMRKLHLGGRIELLQFAMLQGWLSHT